MKITRALLAVALVAGAFSGIAQAENPQYEASIPFNFTVGNQNFSAGDYIFSTIDPLNAVELQSADGHKATFVNSDPMYSVLPAKQSELVFQHDGNRYFLSEVHTQGTDAGLQVHVPRHASEAAPATKHDVVSILGTIATR